MSLQPLRPVHLIAVLLVAVAVAACDSTGPASERPEVTITAPEDATLYGYGEAVTFAGSADDPEDGPLTGDALAWESDIDGLLGTGGEITVDTLSGGTHIVALIATDSDGVKGTATVAVIVEQPPR
jgi:hypothetical protein